MEVHIAQSCCKSLSLVSALEGAFSLRWRYSGQMHQILEYDARIRDLVNSNRVLGLQPDV